MRARLYRWLGWFLCETAFRTDMRGTEWPYRLGCRFYGRWIDLTPELDAGPGGPRPQ
jgi:hypothetical protein